MNGQKFQGGKWLFFSWEKIKLESKKKQIPKLQRLQNIQYQTFTSHFFTVISPVPKTTALGMVATG